MNPTRKELESYTFDMLARTGAEIANALFAAEITWPADTPPRCFEQAWDRALNDTRRIVAEVFEARGYTVERDIAILQDIAADGFIARFEKLNDGWMNEGGNA